MPGAGTEFFRDLEASGLFDLRAKVVSREFVRFIEDHQIPSRGEQFLLKLFITGHLIEPHDKMVKILEGISGRRGSLKGGRKHIELKAELLEQLVAPLLDQAARSH